MKTLLYILVKNPFTQRDFERMGVGALQQYFEVRILDCTAWLMPQAIATRGSSTMKLPNMYLISSLSELNGALKDSSGGIAIDYVGAFSLRAIWLFHCLKEKGIKLVVMDSGAYPLPEERNVVGLSKSKLIYAIKDRYIQRSLNAVIRKIALKVLPDQSPDFALVSGTSWMSDPRFNRAAKKIAAHSFDYEKYLQLRSLPSSRGFDYAVYLDENIADHEDNAELGYAAPASERKFLGALTKFFTEFEAVSGMPILVAGYPTEQPGARSKIYGDREIIYAETADLIRNAKVVFAHASTAISFAVLWRRPLVFLTSDEITGSWYYPWIEAPRKILKASIVNINSETPGQCDIDEWQKVDHSAYKRYKDTYIKSQGSPEISLWSIFLKVKLEEATSK